MPSERFQSDSDQIVNEHPGLRPFAAHGIEFHKVSKADEGHEAEATCLECDKDLLHINTVKQIFHCKTCDYSGNLQQFLESRAKAYEKAFTLKLRRKLARSWGLPADALSKAGIGWDGNNFTITIRDYYGNVVNIRTYRRKKLVNTPGLPTALYGAEHLRKKPKAIVYVCEGEKDAIALRYLLKKAGSPAVVVAVPGAGIFKRDWAPWFEGRQVVALYDNDEAGAKGEIRLLTAIESIAESIQFIRWPEGDAYPDGFDVRDWVSNGSDRGQEPKTICRELLSLVHSEPRTKHQRAKDSRKKSPAKEKPNQREKLLKLANRLELFQTPDGVPFATYSDGGKIRATAPIGSAEISSWLILTYHEEEGKPVANAPLKDVIRFLQAQAGRSDCHEVFNRVGGTHKTIYIDLADGSGRAVLINSEGWKIVIPKKCRFWRPKRMRRLPIPRRKGSLDRLRALLNVDSDDDWALLLGWIVSSLRPFGPYFILVLKGEQGSAKSTVSRILRRIIDPNVSELRGPPREAQDLAISAHNAWGIVLDNVSNLSQAISDALCRLSTGGGLATRKLYSDLDEIVLDAKRPVIINGIDDLTTRADLAERCIHIELQSIPPERRRTEKDVWSEFEEIAAEVFGALCDALVAAIARQDKIELKPKPRMADGVLWAVAAERALGLPDGSFQRAYQRNLEVASNIPLEASLIVEPLSDLLNRSDGRWDGTATKLLTRLKRGVTFEVAQLKPWPKAPNILSGQLNQITPNLRAIGIDVSFPGKLGSQERIITIRRIDDSVLTAPRTDRALFTAPRTDRAVFTARLCKTKRKKARLTKATGKKHRTVRRRKRAAGD